MGATWRHDRQYIGRDRHDRQYIGAVGAIGAKVGAIGAKVGAIGANIGANNFVAWLDTIAGKLITR